MKNKPGISIGNMLVISLLCFISCNTADEKNTDTKTPVLKTEKVIKEKDKDQVSIEKPAIINIMDTIAPKRIIIYMKDSAKVIERIGIKLGVIYAVKLAEVLKKNGIKMTGAPMAWYKSQKPPFFFEAGVPVNKKPAKLPKNVFVREMKADSVLQAHFYGPYNLLSQGYDALKERLKDIKKYSAGAPYEIYIGDPVNKNGKPVDPYKVRTDIIFPYK